MKCSWPPALEGALADKRPFLTRPLLAFICLYLWLSVPLLAQNAELSGLITDPANRAVPKARVVVQSAKTAATRAVFSNGHGEYSFPAMLPGPYDITVEANGFKTLHQNAVVVEVDHRARLDFALTIGSTRESITVNGTAPLLNTSDASVSTLIGNQFVENLPLNGRSFSSLIDLAPGVVLTPVNQYEGGSVQCKRPAPRCQLLSWSMGSAPTWEMSGAAPTWAKAEPASFPQPARSAGPATLYRSTHSKSSVFRLRPLLRNMAVLPELKYQWSPSPALTRFTVPRSSTSAMTNWTPTIGLATPAL